MNLTIDYVNPKVREWQGEKYAGNCSVQVKFSNGDLGEYNTKTDKAQTHIDALTAIIGKPGEFEVANTKEYEGRTTHVFKNYPGKAQPSFGGGGGGKRDYVPAFHQTREGVVYEQERMDRRTALMQAVAWLVSDGSVETSHAITAAETFYAWLRKTAVEPPVVAPVAPATGAPAQVPAGEVRSAGAVWEGPGQCPRCFAPEGKRHGKPCI